MADGWTVSQNHSEVVWERAGEVQRVRMASATVSGEVIKAIDYHRLLGQLNAREMPGLLDDAYLN